MKLKNIDIPNRKIAANLKDIHPNPHETNQIIVGGNSAAQLVRLIESADLCDNQSANLIELRPGADAMLSAGDDQVANGQVIAVEILAADLPQASVVVG